MSKKRNIRKNNTSKFSKSMDNMIKSQNRYLTFALLKKRTGVALTEDEEKVIETFIEIQKQNILNKE